MEKSSSMPLSHEDDLGPACRSEQIRNSKHYITCHLNRIRELNFENGMCVVTGLNDLCLVLGGIVTL